MYNFQLPKIRKISHESAPDLSWTENIKDRSPESIGEAYKAQNRQQTDSAGWLSVYYSFVKEKLEPWFSTQV